MVLRWIAWGVVGAAVLVGAGAAMMDRIAGPLTVTDPLTATPPRKASNWALALPPGSESAARPTHDAPVWEATPAELTALFHQIALAERGVEALDSPEGGQEDSPVAGYVQRSRILRFPDVISVRAIDLGGGRASLAIYSRSLIGSDDWGVNAARVSRWLAALERARPPLRQVASAAEQAAPDV